VPLQIGGAPDFFSEYENEYENEYEREKEQECKQYDERVHTHHHHQLSL